jgi:membrane protein
MLGVLKSVAIGFGRDKIMRLASSIAFGAIFSIAPLLIVVIGVAGWLLGINNGGHGNHLAENAILDQVNRAAGPGAADTVRQMIAAAFNKPRQSVIAQIVGWVTFALGAAALFGALQDSLNSIWQIESTKGGWKQMVRGRTASFLMILVVIFLLLGTFAANASIAFATTHFSNPLGSVANAAVVATSNLVVTFILLTLAFAAIYKVLPDVSIGWRGVWIGALVTALLFLLGEALIALYLSRAAVASAYGAAGSLLAMLLWIYYSSIVLLVGAEFTKVAARRVRTFAPSTVRKLTEHPAGIDPRSA